jgi:hypothetical protein
MRKLPAKPRIKAKLAKFRCTQRAGTPIPPQSIPFQKPVSLPIGKRGRKPGASRRKTDTLCSSFRKARFREKRHVPLSDHIAGTDRRGWLGEADSWGKSCAQGKGEKDTCVTHRDSSYDKVYAEGLHKIFPPIVAGNRVFFVRSVTHVTLSSGYYYPNAGPCGLCLFVYLQSKPVLGWMVP